MNTITLNQQKELRKAYKNHFAGKNWGTWSMENAPELPVSYQLLQYKNDKNQICDVIKFSEPVILENRSRTNQAYCLSKYKPNHRVGEWWREIPSVTVRTCKDCNTVFPVNSTKWASSRKCIKCGEKLFDRFKNWLIDYVEKQKDANLGWAKHVAKHNFGNLDEYFVIKQWDEVTNKS